MLKTTTMTRTCLPAFKEYAGTRIRTPPQRTRSPRCRAHCETQPDLILLDLHLPDAHGADTIHGAMHYAADIPVLVLTGSGNEQIGQSSDRCGVQDFIPKTELFSAHLPRSIDLCDRRKQMLRDSEQRAVRDPLTGLSNRTD